jgi:alpha-ribazole phosphatase
LPKCISAIDAWADDPFGFRAPGGESSSEMATRVLAWLAELQSAAPAVPVVVVAHGGPLRAIAGHLLGLPREHWLALDFAFAHSTRIDIEDWGTTLKWFNR